MPRRAKKKVVERADPETWYGRVVTSVGRRGQRGRRGGKRTPEDEGGRSARGRAGTGSSGTGESAGTGEECRTSQWSEG